MKIKRIIQAISLVLISGPVLAQAPEPPASKPPAKPEKITVTGSSIKRVADEGALPLQVITKDEIDKAGIISAEQLVATLTANGNGADNLSSNMGIINTGTEARNNNGNTSANLRGLGAGSTLVLLNSRRVALHGAKGNAVDLNSIPLAAVERVEVLRDGASAIYGTDAIGGVINFITKKDFRGIDLTAFTDVTHDGGGDITRVSVTGGLGNLSTGRFNILGSLTVDRQEKLEARERSFVNGYQPARGLSPDTTGTPFATQTGGAGTAIGSTFTTPNLGTGTQTFNRANLLSFQGRCADGAVGMSQYESVLWGSPGFRWGCAFDYVGQQSLIQPLDRANALVRATFQISANHTAIAEFVGSKTTAERQFEQSQIVTSVAAGNAYPVNGPHYQDLSQFIPSFNRNLPIAYRWRCVDCGKRTIETETEARRFLVGFEGVLGRFDYRLGVSAGKNSADSILPDGYMRTVDFNNVLASGIVNPWLLPGQSQSAAAMAAIESAKARGAKLFGGETTLRQADGALSGEIWQLPAGPVAAAVGFDVRKETYKFSDGSASSGPVRDAPFDPEFPKVSRDIKAVYAEVAIPVLRQLEVTAAVRRDDYSDFGATTNPKVSLRFNPIENFLVRASYNEGFRAPTFTQLYGAVSESPSATNLRDPVLCPTGTEGLSVCAIRPLIRSGGNPGIQPETSKQWTVGFVASPTEWLTGSIDLWQIRREDRIYQLSGTQVINNFTTFPQNLVRGATGRLDEPGGFIRAGFVNADGDILRGLEIGLQAATRWNGGNLKADFNGTHIISYKSRVFVTQDYEERVGRHSTLSSGYFDLYLRWKHTLTVTYSKGPWSFRANQQYSSSYTDEKPLGVVPPGFKPDVESYTVYNASATYTGFKNLTLTAGIKNLFNTDPPFTAHNVDFAPGAGWDPRVADPRGRAYTLRLSYKF